MKGKWKNVPQNSLERECLDYFDEKAVFVRLLKGFKEKYASFGSFSGTVELRNLSSEDVENLEGFFQKNYHGKKSASISASHFEKALKNSRFGNIEPKKLLEFYFQEEMTGKKEQRQAEERQRLQLMEKVRKKYEGTPAQMWLEDLEDRENRSLLMKYSRESGNEMEKLEELFHLAANIINKFPYRKDTREYLAVFAAMITENPHAFDAGTRGGNLLFTLIKWDIKKRGISIVQSSIFPALQKQRFYFAAGILLDDISNYSMLSGVRVWKKDGEVHAGMEGFCREGDMVQIPLNVIAGWEKIDCPGHCIYILENPSVYAMFCRKWHGKRACMCMNGQPRLSSLLVLDLLAASGVKVYYAGDFDPEGLLIAQKLKQYYPGEFAYWKMSEDVYESSRSGEIISEKRMKMLEQITDEELQLTVQAIRKSKRAGYQENVWKVYFEN